MYNVFDYLRLIRSFKNNEQKTIKPVHTLQYICPIPSKNEPYEVDKPVPQKYIYS